jgi:WD40 repeat protein
MAMSHFKILTAFVFLNLAAAGVGTLVLRPADKQPVPVLKGHQYWVNHVAFSPDGATLASAAGMLDRAGEVILWDLAGGEEKLRLDIPRGAVYAVSFSPDGSQLATAHEDHTVRLWDARSGKLLWALIGHTDRVNAVLFAPDGQTLASSGRDYTVRLWNVADGRLRWRVPGFGQMAFLPDQQTLAVGSGASGHTKLWDLATGLEKARLQSHPTWVLCVAESPDGRTIAAAGFQTVIQLWDLESKQVRAVLAGHRDNVHSLAFSPDGRQLVSASQDGTVKLWDAVKGREIATIGQHEGPVNAVAFAPDGKLVASAGYDKKVSLWRVPEQG